MDYKGVTEEVTPRVTKMPSRKSNPIRVPIDLVEYLDNLKETLSKLTGIEIGMWNRQHAAKALKLMASRGKLLKNEAEDIFMGRMK